MGLATRLGLGYCFVIAMLLGIVAADSTASFMARAANRRVVERILPSIDAADQLLIEVERMQTAELLMVARPERLARWGAEFDAGATAFEHQFARLQESVSTPAGRAHMADIDRRFGAYQEVDRRIRRLLAAGDAAGARELNETASLEIATALVGATRQFRGFELELNSQVSRDGDRALQAAQALGLAIAALAIASAAAIWWRTSRDVVEPLANLTAAAWQLDGEAPVKADHPAAWRTRELGELQGRFNQAAGRLLAVATMLRASNVDLEAQVAERTRELRQLVAELQTLDKLKSDFMSVASHELLTPINFITGFGSSLEDGLFGPLTEDQAEVVHQMMAGADRLTRMVRNILTYTQLQADQLPFAPEAVDLGALLRDVADAAAPEAQARGVALELALDPEAPLAWADPLQTGLAARELLDNAIKFSPAGGRVVVRLEPRPEAVAVAIEDAGAGMPAQVLPHLFEPFYQADATSTRAHGGLGLGLAIAHGIVSRSGGRLDLRTEVGVGTRVCIELPRAAEA
jgi:signal transduction histidine kinase